MKNVLTVVSTLLIGASLTLSACGKEKKPAATEPAAAEPAKAEPAAAAPAAAAPAAAEPAAADKPKEGEAAKGGW
jgi:hypothetical protein